MKTRRSCCQQVRLVVVAVNWDEAQVLYGECKWKRTSALTEKEVVKLIARSEQVQLKTQSGRPFKQHYIFFSRSGFTDPARQLGAILVDLPYRDAIR